MDYTKYKLDNANTGLDRYLTKNSTFCLYSTIVIECIIVVLLVMSL
jgi:hypothetical protein